MRKNLPEVGFNDPASGIFLFPTSDFSVFIEEQYEGYIRYRNILTGRRWEVRGVCDRRGDCLIGAVIDGVQIRDHEHLRELVRFAGKERIDSELDVVVTPEFKTCCGKDIFTYSELQKVGELDGN